MKYCYNLSYLFTIILEDMPANVDGSRFNERDNDYLSSDWDDHLVTLHVESKK